MKKTAPCPRGRAGLPRLFRLKHKCLRFLLYNWMYYCFLCYNWKVFRLLVRLLRCLLHSWSYCCVFVHNSKHNSLSPRESSPPMLVFLSLLCLVLSLVVVVVVVWIVLVCIGWSDNHFRNLRFKTARNIKDCSAAHVVSWFVSSEIMAWRN